MLKLHASLFHGLNEEHFKSYLDGLNHANVSCPTCPAPAQHQPHTGAGQDSCKAGEITVDVWLRREDSFIVVFNLRDKAANSSQLNYLSFWLYPHPHKKENTMHTCL